MSKRKSFLVRWTAEQVEDFRAWHETIIAKYPEKLRLELRRTRTKWLRMVEPRPIATLQPQGEKP